MTFALFTTRRWQIGVLLLTLWQYLYAVAFVAAIVFVIRDSTTALEAGASREALDERYTHLFLAMLPVHLCTMVQGMFLTVYYVVHVLKNRALKDTRRAMWGIAILAAGIVVIPFYYWMYVWTEAVEAERA